VVVFGKVGKTKLVVVGLMMRLLLVVQQWWRCIQSQQSTRKEEGKERAGAESLCVWLCGCDRGSRE
jgi:hypothetical protein